nr:hypothetical protein [Tanacetum cinerariifolium]
MLRSFMCVEDSEDDDKEEEEHLALADSSDVPVDDLVPSAEDTEAFETDDSAPIPSPRRHTARMSVRPQTPMSAITEALIAEYASAPTPSSPPPSPLSPLSSPLPQIPLPPLPLPSPPTTSPTYAEAPLGYRAAEIRLRVASLSTYHPSEIPSPHLLLPSTTHRDDLPKYPECLEPSDAEASIKDQPLLDDASLIALSLGYVADLDSEEDPEEDLAEYLADRRDDADDESSDDDDDKKEEEEEKPQPPTLSFTKEDAERFLAIPIPPPSPLTLLSSPLPQIPSPPLPASPFILPIPLPAGSPPLQLLSSNRRADRPEVTLPPQKSLSIVHCLGYKAGESLVAAAARSIEGRRADYGFVDSGHLVTALGEIRALQARE